MKRKIDHETEKANSYGYCSSVTCHFLRYILHSSKSCRQAELRRLCCQSTPPWTEETTRMYKTDDKITGPNHHRRGCTTHSIDCSSGPMWERVKYLCYPGKSEQVQKRPSSLAKTYTFRPSSETKPAITNVVSHRERELQRNYSQSVATFQRLVLIPSGRQSLKVQLQASRYGTPLSSTAL